MNKENLVTFNFTTSDGEEVFISGKLIHSTYDTYFDIRSAITEDGVLDEEDFCEEDLERMIEEAEEFLLENELYRE